VTSLLPSSPQEDLDAYRVAIREFLTVRAPRANLRSLMESGGRADSETWLRAATELGVQGLLVPETLGGAGAGADVASVALSELGGALTIGPFLPTIIGSHALVASQTQESVDILTGIVAGNVRLAIDYRSLRQPIGIDEMSSPSVVLDTTFERVPDVIDADVLLIGVTDGSANGLCVVWLTAESIEIDPLRSLDLTRTFGRLTLKSAVASVLPESGDGLSVTGDIAGLLLAAEQLGVIDRVLREDVAYLSDREAFGRKVGSFQAVKHQLAQIYCQWEQGTALLNHALTVVGDPTSRKLAVDTLQCFVGPAAVEATTVALRLLGGIGFTWEHDAHLYFRRARASESMLENIHVRRSRLAANLGLLP